MKKYFIYLKYLSKNCNGELASIIGLDLEEESIAEAAKACVIRQYPFMSDVEFEVAVISFNNIE